MNDTSQKRCRQQRFCEVSLTSVSFRIIRRIRHVLDSASVNRTIRALTHSARRPYDEK